MYRVPGAAEGKLNKSVRIFRYSTWQILFWYFKLGIFLITFLARLSSRHRRLGLSCSDSRAGRYPEQRSSSCPEWCQTFRSDSWWYFLPDKTDRIWHRKQCRGWCQLEELLLIIINIRTYQDSTNNFYSNWNQYDTDQASRDWHRM